MTSLAAATRLQAVTRRFDAPADLLDARSPGGFAWLRDGGGLVTSGVAARVDVADAPAALASLDLDDPLGWPGTGALAVGALPFDPAAPGSLVIPSVVVGRTADGDSWITTVGPASAPLHLRPRDPEPGRFQVSAATDRSHWGELVHAALDSIGDGQLEKVVLARSVVVEADRPFVVSAVLARLCAAQPGCFVHHCDGLVGASPELLVRRVGTTVESRPLAGTARQETGAAAALRASAKDAWEHRLVVDAVVDALAPLCSELDVPPDPTAVAFPSVVHLATAMRGVLAEPAPSALELAQRLHPTPAVGGSPRDVALATITALEPEARGRYAGPVGWVDRRGDGEWAVALRGGELDGNRAVLRAGAGIVVGSDPEAEWRETQTKFEPMLQALVCP